MNRVPGVLILMVVLAASGCMSSSNSQSDPGSSESGFGNRENDGDGGRATVVITSVPNADDYVVGPAPFESADVRVGKMSNGRAPVELLIKGAFPDACTELHGANQTRNQTEIIVEIQARRPGNAMCASVMRSYRFYLTIEGTFESGRYILDLNGVRQGFDVN
jgi:hypothetical protein